MDESHSTTGPSGPEKTSTAVLAAQWKTIDWSKAQAYVNRLQTRIAKATAEKKWNLVKRLQYLLTHSYYAKLLAVRKVTTNKGHKTPGIDNVKWGTPSAKMAAALSLTDRRYKAKPLRRTYIKKKGNAKKLRPLGIPCMYDRAMQALYALALDPAAETLADTRSFGFRKGRSTQDACDQLFYDLCYKTSPPVVLEGDIRGCFDHISHEWLLEHIPMDKSILKQFLKAGFVFKGELFPSTEEGTPQGGIISPILANMALDGMQKTLDDYFSISGKGRPTKATLRASKVHLTRYADDFVVTAETEEIAGQAMEVIRAFLKVRGLELSEEKTLITRVTDGFDFLGWTFRKFRHGKQGHKLIIKPSVKSVKNFTASTHDIILARGKSLTQDVLIYQLNQKITGWVNYHQMVCSKETFSHIDHILFQQLWRWAVRRHPTKNHHWVKARYWHIEDTRRWVFKDESAELHLAADTRIHRHIRLSIQENPYLNPEYFADHKFKMGLRRISGKFKKVWKKQQGLCFLCGLPIDLEDDDEEREIIFKVPESEGGNDSVDNMAYVHRSCRMIFDERRVKT